MCVCLYVCAMYAIYNACTCICMAMVCVYIMCMCAANVQRDIHGRMSMCHICRVCMAVWNVCDVHVWYGLGYLISVCVRCGPGPASVVMV